jgi:uncharacterized membrane protein
VKLSLNFALTSFDKAIVAAILSPVLALLVNWAGGGQIDQRSLLAAIASGLVAGITVYLKGNLPSGNGALTGPNQS